MNEPIRKLGTNNGKAVYELNGKQTVLHMGFNPTAYYHGYFKDHGTGEFKNHFAPNRKQRRQALRTKQNRPYFGKFVRRWQGELDKNGKPKIIGHYIQ